MEAVVRRELALVERRVDDPLGDVVARRRRRADAKEDVVDEAVGVVVVGERVVAAVADRILGALKVRVRGKIE